MYSITCSCQVYIHLKPPPFHGDLCLCTFVLCLFSEVYLHRLRKVLLFARASRKKSWLFLLPFCDSHFGLFFFFSVKTLLISMFSALRVYEDGVRSFAYIFVICLRRNPIKKMRRSSSSPSRALQNANDGTKPF